jgi:hypothetical protein
VTSSTALSILLHTGSSSVLDEGVSIPIFLGMTFNLRASARMVARTAIRS